MGRFFLLDEGFEGRGVSNRPKLGTLASESARDDVDDIGEAEVHMSSGVEGDVVNTDPCRLDDLMELEHDDSELVLGRGLQCCTPMGRTS